MQVANLLVYLMVFPSLAWMGGARAEDVWQAVQSARMRVELAQERLQLAVERADPKRARDDLAAAQAHLITALDAVRRAEAALAAGGSLKSPAMAAPPLPTALAKPASGPPQGECPCGSGLTCTGPRGGAYCVTPSGRKRYQ